MVIEQPQMGLTFEQVWAALMETRERQIKTDAQIDRMSAEIEKNAARVDAQITKMSEKVDRVTENVGGLNRSMGELIETLIAARLWEKFDAYPYNLKRAYQRVPVFNENNEKVAEIDILLSNGEYVMVVEVKRELDKEKDVNHHLERMELVKQYLPAECVGKKVLSAMAGGVVDFDVQNYAHSAGFFVLELTGESVHLVESPKDFIPREW